jgi:hypothetical protein
MLYKTTYNITFNLSKEVITSLLSFAIIGIINGYSILQSLTFGIMINVVTFILDTLAVGALIYLNNKLAYMEKNYNDVVTDLNNLEISAISDPIKTYQSNAEKVRNIRKQELLQKLRTEEKILLVQRFGSKLQLK